MHPLTVSELGKDFNLGHSLKYGQLPSVYIEKDPKAYLESYIKNYLEEEIQQEGLTRSLAGFARFLEAASFSQGSILSISSVARVSGVMLKGLKSFLQDYPMSKAYFVYGGSREMRDGRISIFPIEDALRRLPELLS